MTSMIVFYEGDDDIGHYLHRHCRRDTLHDTYVTLGSACSKRYALGSCFEAYISLLAFAPNMCCTWTLTLRLFASLH